MKTIKQSLLIIGIALFIAVSGIPTLAESQQTVLVGRISHIEGEVLRYVPENKDWVATVKDAPFGFNDALYSGRYSKAEIILPNNTWFRIGSDTQVQLISVGNDLTDADIGVGIARFYNRSSIATIRVSTPFGTVTAPPTACFDVYVTDNSAEVIALNGKVEFVHISGGDRYEVKTGLSSVIADKIQVRPGDGRADADWNSWNVARNHIWDGRMNARGESVKYLPEPLHTDSYVLEENGRWERVYYENEYRYFWRPIRVAPAWAPFTVGRWTEWYGDHCWIPAEPFGYVTHHYGNWLYVNNFWYWAPPLVSIGIGRPSFSIGFGWYPGRVSWIHSGVHVGWVPLAPHEIYYCHRYWGPHSMVAAYPGIHISIGGYRYADRAIVIHRNNFYHTSDYSRVKIARIDHATIVNHYRAAPVINNTVIHNYDSAPQRHHFTNAAVTQKPRHSAVNRIYQNEQIIKGDSRARSNIMPETNFRQDRHGTGTPRTNSFGTPEQRRQNSSPSQPDRVRPSVPSGSGMMRHSPQSGQERRTMQQNVQPSQSVPAYNPRRTMQQPSQPSQSSGSESRHSDVQRQTIQPSVPAYTPRRTMQQPSQPSQPSGSESRQFRHSDEQRRTMQPSQAIQPSVPAYTPRRTIQQPSQPTQSSEPTYNLRRTMQPPTTQTIQPRHELRTTTPERSSSPASPSQTMERRSSPVQIHQRTPQVQQPTPGISGGSTRHSSPTPSVQQSPRGQHSPRSRVPEELR